MAIALLALPVDCANLAPDAIQALDQDVTVAAGSSVRVGDTKVVVRFEGVLNDSRCPADVQCISAGDASVLVTASTGGAVASRYELHTNSPPHEAIHDRLRLTLVDLRPVPVSTRTTRSSEYVLTLRVSQVR